MVINTPTFPPSQTSKWVPLKLSDVKYIILHHAQAIFATYETINQWHLENGWAGIGYNEYIRKDGTVYIGRGDNIGAQCAGMNSVSYGICVEGNYEIETEMPEAQKLSLIARIIENKRRFPNFKCVAPHSQFVDTRCPGKNFGLVEILSRIEVTKLTVEESLKLQVELGVINSPDYWRKVIDTTKNFDAYVINVGIRLAELKNK